MSLKNATDSIGFRKDGTPTADGSWTKKRMDDAIKEIEAAPKVDVDPKARVAMTQSALDVEIKKR